MLSVFFAWGVALVLYLLSWKADYGVVSVIGYVMCGLFALAGTIRAYQKARE